MLFNLLNDALMTWLCTSVIVSSPQGPLSCEELFAPALNGLSLLIFISFVYAFKHYPISFLDSDLSLTSFPCSVLLSSDVLFWIYCWLRIQKTKTGMGDCRVLDRGILLPIRIMTFLLGCMSSFLPHLLSHHVSDSCGLCVNYVLFLEVLTENHRVKI